MKSALTLSKPRPKQKKLKKEITGFISEAPAAFTSTIYEVGGKPAIVTSFHKEWMHLHFNGRFGKTLLLAARGHGKTHSIVAYCLFRLCRNPNLRILVISATLDQAVQIIGLVKRNIKQNTKIHAFFPHIKIGDTDKANEFTLVREKDAKEPTMKAAGEGTAAIVGMHCDIVICDDICSEQNTLTEKLMEKTKSWFFTDLRPVVEHDGELHIIGTPREEGDLYDVLKATGEYETRVYPAIADPVWDENSHSFTAGTPLWPEFYDMDALSALRRERNEYYFTTQYLCGYTTGEKALFKREWLRYAGPGEIDRIDRQSVFHFFAVDPAIKISESACETVIAIVMAARRNGRSVWYVLDIIHGHFSINTTAQELARLYDKHRPLGIAIESNAYQLALSQELKRRRPALQGIVREVFSVRGRGKDARAHSLVPWFENGRVYLPEGADWLAEFETQFVRYPKTQKKDMIDALSWIPEIHRDPPDSRYKERQALYEQAELEACVDYEMGY